MSETATYQVQGMTCDHCVNAVSDEIRRLDGVTGVEVDLASGRVAITSDEAVPRGDVVAAIDEAGYELAP